MSTQTMSKRSAQPALYEKINMRSGSLTASPPARVEPKPVAISDRTTPWISPGQSVRLPVGYLLLAGAVVLFLLFATYMFSYKQGFKAAQAEVDQALLQAANAQMEATLIEPLKEVPAGSSVAAAPPKSSTSPKPAAARHPSAWGALRGDPRQKGLNYFVLAEGTAAGIMKLAEFCRANGLETYVVPSKNERLRAIALPGFGSAERSSQAVKALESQIHRIGEQWKKQDRSNSDLHDAYPSLYSG
jgi:hypothetical protein